MSTDQTRKQREATTSAIVTGFIEGWFGQPAAHVTPLEMRAFLDELANYRNLQFIHRLLCQLHTLILNHDLYQVSAAEIGDL